jgi:hypothetical protein
MAGDESGTLRERLKVDCGAVESFFLQEMAARAKLLSDDGEDPHFRGQPLNVDRPHCSDQTGGESDPIRIEAEASTSTVKYRSHRHWSGGLVK